jgi:hypothetical protein
MLIPLICLLQAAPILPYDITVIGQPDVASVQVIPREIDDRTVDLSQLTDGLVSDGNRSKARQAQVDPALKALQSANQDTIRSTGRR